ncbi:glycosyltransferase family 2 protein [Butyrivibrio sp. NC3005]|uniref:glycosyltransferase family 2 protein n=1 Tax=Butyrivibrio sp. NC3005 TaxID=1280685 RepID=UPI000416A13E|nr:glycosyltransferase family 2 protein [Butyrivibrio sp. NC3005]
MSDLIKVSIIIPAYNSEKTISATLDTVVKQTLSDIEIIIINDASTDRTMQIIQRYQTDYSGLIHVIDSKEHKGPGGCRNLGLNAAKGQYIGFVDSDDFINANMYKKLYSRAMEGGFEIVDCAMYDQSLDKIILQASDKLTGVLTDEKRSYLISLGGYLPTKIFHRRLFENPQIRMRENCILEDYEIMAYLYARAHSIGNVKETLYQYNNTFGASTKISNPSEYIRNVSGAMQALYNTLSPLPNYENIRLSVESQISKLYSYGIEVCIFMEQKGDDIYAPILEKTLCLLHKKLVYTQYEENPFTTMQLSADDIQMLHENDEKY